MGPDGRIFLFLAWEGLRALLLLTFLLLLVACDGSSSPLEQGNDCGVSAPFLSRTVEKTEEDIRKTGSIPLSSYKMAWSEAKILRGLVELYRSRPSAENLSVLESRLYLVLPHILSFAHIVHSGAVLENYVDALEFPISSALREGTKRVIEDVFGKFEHSWDGTNYTIITNKNERLIGQPLPFNQYISIAGVYAAYFHYWGDVRFSAKVESMLRYSEPHLLVREDGSIYWRYWTTYGKIEDIGHGEIVIRSYKRMAKFGFVSMEIPARMLRGIVHHTYSRKTCSLWARLDGQQFLTKENWGGLPVDGDLYCGRYLTHYDLDPGIISVCGNKLNDDWKTLIGDAVALRLREDL